MNIWRNIFLICIITLVPWIIFLSPWDFLLTTLHPWAPWVTVLATAMSPLIAVQVTRYLDRRHELHSEKMSIFQNLMAFRPAQMQSIEFCRAVNLVDVVFKNEQQVLDALSKYHSEVLFVSSFAQKEIDKMSKDEQDKFITQFRIAMNTRNEALNNLLNLMAKTLNVSISHHAISNNGVWPTWVSQNQMAAVDIAKSNREFLDMAQKTSSQPDQNIPQNIDKTEEKREERNS